VTATAIRLAARDHAHSRVDDAAAFGAADLHGGHRKLHEERERPRAPRREQMSDDLSGEYAIIKYRHIEAVDADRPSRLVS
jgi:hypothetical protein